MFSVYHTISQNINGAYDTSKISYITGDSNVFVILYQGFIQDFISEESVSKNRGGAHTGIPVIYLLTYSLEGCCVRIYCNYCTANFTFTFIPIKSTKQFVSGLCQVSETVHPLMGTGNYSDTSNNMKLVHWPLMGGLLHLVQRGGTGRGRSPPRPLLTAPNVTAHPSTASVPITVLLYNGSLICGFNVPIKGLMLTCSLCVAYHRFVIIVDMYIDSLQPLVYYRLNSAVLVYIPILYPLCCTHVRGCCIKTRGL